MDPLKSRCKWCVHQRISQRTLGSAASRKRFLGGQCCAVGRCDLPRSGSRLGFVGGSGSRGDVFGSIFFCFPPKLLYIYYIHKLLSHGPPFSSHMLCFASLVEGVCIGSGHVILACLLSSWQGVCMQCGSRIWSFGKLSFAVFVPVRVSALKAPKLHQNAVERLVGPKFQNSHRDENTEKSGGLVCLLFCLP